jgi:NTP pyrophosphatase (non-canonical NTP hydrolase)
MKLHAIFSIGSTRWAGISKLVEEAGEVIQVCGKLMGTNGEVEHWDGSNLRQRLEEEIGDVLAAVDFVLEQNPGLNATGIAKRRASKLELFRQWQAGLNQ